MRLVAIEEHYAPPAVAGRVPRAVLASRGWLTGEGRPGLAKSARRLRAVDRARIADMDSAGITLQVLSYPGAGAELLDAGDALRFARECNDAIVTAGRSFPGRFAGFAHLPIKQPEAAADELERAVRDLGLRGALVNGTTEGEFLDSPRFSPVLARAEALGVPIYLHPSLPPEEVLSAYFAGLPGHSGFLLAGPGFGWHAETAIHVLRLVLAGVFERFPRLDVIVGHAGEGLAWMMERLDEVFGDHARDRLSRAVSETLRDRLWVTISGFFSKPAFDVALSAFGSDRLMFAVDYPFASNERGASFLCSLGLEQSALERIAHRNADTLLRLSDSGDPSS